MKYTKQTLHLIHFHCLTTPIYMWLVFVALPLCLCLFIGRLGLDSYGEIRSNPQLFGLIYMPILAAQTAWGVTSVQTRNNPQVWGSSWRYFFASQPIDRNRLYLANSIVFLLLILIILSGIFVPAFFWPDHTLIFFNAERATKTYNDVLLPVFQNARLIDINDTDVKIIIPGAHWLMAAMTAAQLCLLSIYVYWACLATRRYKSQTFIIISLFMMLCLLPLLGLKFPKLRDTTFDYQTFFLFFVQNQLWIWLVIGLIAALAWWDGRNRFIKNF